MHNFIVLYYAKVLESVNIYQDYCRKFCVLLYFHPGCRYTSI